MDIEDGIPTTLAKMIDERWTHKELCAPFPDEDFNQHFLKHLIETLKANIKGLRQAGHNIILTTLALKAFRDCPEAVTPSRVSGLCKLVEAFSLTDVPMDDNVEFPDMGDLTSASEFILKEFVTCTERFKGRGQGWSGHLLTYGRALLDLRELGYIDIAQRAEEGFEIYIRRICLGPLSSDKPRQEHSPTALFPLNKAYWKQRRGDWNLGHVMKYPYGFYGLMKLAKDEDVKERCLGAAYRIF